MLRKLDDVLERHYASNELRLPLLAHEMGTSERQLQRRLKQLTGYTPAAFVRRYRLIRSLNHLRSGMFVQGCARAVGFSSQSYFASCFKEEFGVAPTHYRNTS
jgi:AraC-like DNA-binding protein